jgi:hypothetical protein
MLNDSYARFYRTSSAAIDFDIIHRLALRGTNDSIRLATIIFDDSTQLCYKIPSWAWEIWYCKTPPGVNLLACITLRYESLSWGVTGWFALLASTNTFVNFQILKRTLDLANCCFEWGWRCFYGSLLRQVQNNPMVAYGEDIWRQ